MKVFVHSATECLTDHEPHGEGLIFLDYLKALTRFGCSFTGGALRVALRNPVEAISISECRAWAPFPSFQRLASNRKLDKQLQAQIRSIDPPSLIWRGNPVGELCPTCPSKFGRPLVLGPLYLGWPLVESERPGLGPSWIARRIARAGWLKTERSADLILCTSTRLAEVYQSRKDVRARIAVIPVIVEAPAGSAPNLLHEKPSAIRLVWTGRFHREKQPLKAVDVLRELTNLGFDAHLTMIGDGILLSEVREVLSRYFSKTKWHLPGAVPNADVWNHLRNSHFFISTAEHEPYGRAIVEAMTMGCVPVCHRSGGPAEFLRHRQTALLIDRSDPLIFAKAIADTTQSFAIWKDLQLAALEKTKQFSSGVVGATMFSLFTALTAGKNRKESDLLPTSN